VALTLAFGISVSEMSATMMLARPSLVTMPVGVYRFLSSREFQAASAMAVLLILVTGGAFLLIEGASRWIQRARDSEPPRQNRARGGQRG